MTERYTAWLASNSQVYSTLTTLGAIAMALVLAWELTRYIPGRLGKWLRRVYAPGGLALYVATIIISYYSTGGKP
jgi:ABC-type Fe3+ transport system permease subunit